MCKQFDHCINMQIFQDWQCRVFFLRTSHPSFSVSQSVQSRNLPVYHERSQTIGGLPGSELNFPCQGTNPRPWAQDFYSFVNFYGMPTRCDIGGRLAGRVSSQQKWTSCLMHACKKKIPKKRKKQTNNILQHISEEKTYFPKASKYSLYQEIYLVDFVFDTSTTTTWNQTKT